MYHHREFYVIANKIILGAAILSSVQHFLLIAFEIKDTVQFWMVFRILPLKMVLMQVLIHIFSELRVKVARFAI